MKLPKLIITDIDGVWTDGGMIYSETGEEFKKFNTYDSAGVLFCHFLKIPVCIMTGENSIAVKRRSEKLNIDYLYLSEKNKLLRLTELCNKLNLSFNDVAYIGDDLNDIQVLSNVGLSACPSSAPKYIQNRVDWVMDKKGGEGVFREFVERIIDKANINIIEIIELNYHTPFEQ